MQPFPLLNRLIGMRQKDGDNMKKIMHRYNTSKYNRFTGGLLFAVISIIALILCISDISDNPASKAEIVIPFIIAVVSLLSGFVIMFRRNEIPKEKA